MQKKMEEPETKQPQPTIEDRIKTIVWLGKQRRQNISRKLRAGKMVRDFR